MLLQEYAVYKIWESNQILTERENRILAKAFENEHDARRPSGGWRLLAMVFSMQGHLK
jgi:hypothetical protein